MKRTILLAACALWPGLAACKPTVELPPEDHPPGGEPRPDAGSVAPPAEAGAPDASDGGESVDAGPEAGAPDAGPAPVPLCNPATTSWTPRGTIPSIPATNFGRFGGISASEQTIAWTLSSGAIQVAQRTSRANPFGAPVTVNPSATPPIASDRVALGSTGTTLIAVSANRSTFVGFDGSGTAWYAVNPNRFAYIRGSIAEVHGQLSEPVLGASGNDLFYLVSTASQPPMLFESRWDPLLHAWKEGSPLVTSALASIDGTHRRRPTGVSSDGLTLFFYDEVASTERAAWRVWPDAQFTTFTALSGGVTEAAPDFRCDTLYFQSASSGKANVETAH